MALAIVIGACGDDDRRLMRDLGEVDLSSPPGDMSGCIPGQGSCAGPVHYFCGADGQSRIMEQVCEGSCDPEMGCVACTAGQRRCDGTVSMVCAPDTSGFVTARDCAENGAECGLNGFCVSECGRAEANRSNIGCEYYPVPLTNGGNFTADRYDFRVVVANPHDSATANVRVFRGDMMVASATVPAGGLTDIPLPWVIGQSDAIDPTAPWSSVTTANGAYRLISDLPVTVAQFNPFEYNNGRTGFSFTNDASLLFPSHAFSGEYFVATYSALSSNRLNGRQPSKFPPYLAVVGTTEEPTSVTVQVSADVARDASGRFPATAAGGSFTLTLAKNEVVTVFAAPPPDCDASRPGFTNDGNLNFCDESRSDLTGSRVLANHPVAVFGGHACAYIPYDAQACDHIENQMPPAQTLGMEYLSAPMLDTSSGDFNIVRVLGVLDGTEVTIDPPQGGVSTLSLQAGAWRELRVTSPFQVTSTRGVVVTQYLVGQNAPAVAADRGDPSMVVLPPREQFRSDYTFVTPSSYNRSTDGQSYLLITRPVGLTITLDGSPVTATFRPVGSMEIATIPVEGGTHQMSASDTFGVVVFGMGITTSYAYPAGLNLEEILVL